MNINCIRHLILLRSSPLFLKITFVSWTSFRIKQENNSQSPFMDMSTSIVLSPTNPYITISRKVLPEFRHVRTCSGAVWKVGRKPVGAAQSGLSRFAPPLRERRRPRVCVWDASLWCGASTFFLRVVGVLIFFGISLIFCFGFNNL